MVWQRMFLLVCGNKNKSWPSLGCMAHDPSIRRQQTNCGVPLRMDRPTLLKQNSRHMTSFSEETGNYLLRSASSTSNSRWIWLDFEDPYGRLLFSFRYLALSVYARHQFFVEQRPFLYNLQNLRLRTSVCHD